MIRAMTKTRKRVQRRVPRKEACPKCGAKCLCKSTRRILQPDGTEMRVRYRYCPVVGCDGAIKETDWLEF